jgi:hypothetical protein
MQAAEAVWQTAPAERVLEDSAPVLRQKQCSPLQETELLLTFPHPSVECHAGSTMFEQKWMPAKSLKKEPSLHWHKKHACRRVNGESY